MLIGGLAVLLGAVVLVVAPLRSVVEVSTADGVAGHLPGGPEPIRLSYVHSIDRLPIQEEMTVDDGEFVVTSTRVRQFGAGMGYTGEGGRGHAEGDWWVVDDLDRPIGPELLIRVGPDGIDHQLQVADRTVDLTSCWPGERVRLEPTRTSMMQIWFGPDLPTTCDA